MMSSGTIAELLKSSSRRLLPVSSARLVKRVMVYPRYLLQLRNCRIGFNKVGKRYPRNIIFIAGLPKSGTTWLKKMLASYPGFHELLIPDVAKYELATGGSHDYELPDDIFSRFDDRLVVTKMHVHGSPHNAELLHKAGIRYVVLFRDLRDVAVSHYFYVRRTPWHPEHPIYSKLEIREALMAFAKLTLGPFRDWVYSWHDNRDSTASLIFRYEDMLNDTTQILRKISQHYGLDDSKDTITRIISEHSFKRLSGGRAKGELNADNFFRKGIAGDWRNHFGGELKSIYKDLIGQFLIDFGYEKDFSW